MTNVRFSCQKLPTPHPSLLCRVNPATRCVIVKGNKRTKGEHNYRPLISELCFPFGEANFDARYAYVFIEYKNKREAARLFPFVDPLLVARKNVRRKVQQFSCRTRREFVCVFCGRGRNERRSNSCEKN